MSAPSEKNSKALLCLEELANMPLGISLEDWSRLSGPILEALTNSENEYRRGMERAAEIADKFAADHRHHSIALPTAGVTIADAILSEANHQSVGGDYSHVVSAYAGTASDENPALNHHSPVASSLRRSESGGVSPCAPGTLSEGEGA